MCMGTIMVVNNHSKMLLRTDGMSEKVHKKASTDRHLSLFRCYIQWKHSFFFVFSSHFTMKPKHGRKYLQLFLIVVVGLKACICCFHSGFRSVGVWRSNVSE